MVDLLDGQSDTAVGPVQVRVYPGVPVAQAMDADVSPQPSVLGRSPSVLSRLENALVGLLVDDALCSGPVGLGQGRVVQTEETVERCLRLYSADPVDAEGGLVLTVLPMTAGAVPPERDIGELHDSASTPHHGQSGRSGVHKHPRRFLSMRRCAGQRCEEI